MSDRVDDLLAGWAARHAPDEARLDELARGVTGALASRPLATLPAPAAPSPWRGRLLWAACGAALALIAVAVRPGPADRAAPAPAFLTDARLRSCAGLLGSVEAALGGRVRWLADLGNDLRLDLAPAAAEAAGRDRLAVRIVVLSRGAGAREWATAWEGTVVTGSEERIVVPLPGSDERLSVWACRLPDRLVAVDARLELAGPVPVSLTTSEVLERSRPRSVLRMTTGGSEVAVWQVVRDLSELSS